MYTRSLIAIYLAGLHQLNATVFRPVHEFFKSKGKKWNDDYILKLKVPQPASVDHIAEDFYKGLHKCYEAGMGKLNDKDIKDLLAVLRTMPAVIEGTYASHKIRKGWQKFGGAKKPSISAMAKECPGMRGLSQEQRTSVLEAAEKLAVKAYANGKFEYSEIENALDGILRRDPDDLRSHLPEHQQQALWINHTSIVKNRILADIQKKHDE